MKCGHCNSENMEGAVFCTVCGERLQKDKNPHPVVTMDTSNKNKKNLIIGIVLFIVVAFIAVCVLMGNDNGSGKDDSQQKERFLQDGQEERENAEGTEENPEDMEEYLETDNIIPEDTDFDMPAATPSEFYGSWYDTLTERCHMEIISVNDAYFDILIDWEVTIRENAHWEISGEYDADKGGIVYKNGVYREEYYPEDGGDVEETVVYNNGEGLIYLKDGELYWEVWVPENIENEFVFQHAGEESTDDDYILPYSDSVRLTDEDIWYLSLQELNYARNEIYARHGRKFQSQELQDYFQSKSWYYGYIEGSDFDENDLSQIEKDNIRLLKEAEFSIDSNGYQLD